MSRDTGLIIVQEHTPGVGVAGRARESPYPMISVEEAQNLVLFQSRNLLTKVNHLINQSITDIKTYSFNFKKYLNPVRLKKLWNRNTTDRLKLLVLKVQ